MTRGAFAALAVALVGACFNPTYHNPTCGPNGECPDGLSCIAGTCQSPGGGSDDAALDGPTDGPLDDVPLLVDGKTCVGTNAWTLCFTGAPPSSVRTLNTAVNTDSPLMCATDITWLSPSQPDACVLAAQSITVSGTVVVTGSRPLVLVATDSIGLAAGSLIDVASHRGGTVGAGANASACAAFPQAPMASTMGGGGGAGASFLAKAGDGGAGGHAATAGLAANMTTAPAVLRGGCKGQDGAAGLNAGSGGVGGNGGGAIYLVANGTISLFGTITASGAGASGAAGEAGGGGGGGSGGMIVLSAATITASNGKLGASGGGGGGGGGSNTGQPGTDPTFSPSPTPGQGGGGGAGNGCGGNGGGGGDGGSLSQAATSGQNGDLNLTCGGGGGGGAIGYIRANVAITGTLLASPAASVVP